MSNASSDNPLTVPPPKKTWKNLGVRAVTGFSLAMICVIPLYIGGWAWAVLVALFGGRMMYEWVRMSDPKPNLITYIIPILGLVVGVIYTTQDQHGFAALAVIVTAICAGLGRMRRGGVLWSALGILYILVPALVMIALRGMQAGFATRGFSLLIFVILCVIAADVGAYFGGSYFKGKKLAPTLSPNKTWSGVISGFVFALIVGALVAAIIGLSPVYGIMLAAPIVILSVLGDLLESALKRKLNVKDSGGLLPGHGGLLDRLDSLMMAVVGAAILLYLLPNIWPI
ncbi:MAG: phosphatidate cytidylyltransferase [Litorimonas sp.]